MSWESQGQIEYTQKPTQRTRPPLIVTTQPQNYYNQHTEFDDGFQCGVTEYKSPKAIGLIVGGNEVRRGQFPW